MYKIRDLIGILHMYILEQVRLLLPFGLHNFVSCGSPNKQRNTCMVCFYEDHENISAKWETAKEKVWVIFLR